MAMSSRERVDAALHLREPDHVPYCELAVDRSLADTLMGWQGTSGQAGRLETNWYTVDESKALAALLGLDNITYVLRAPVYAEHGTGRDGRLFYGEGKIKAEADLPLLQLPDPYDDRLYEGARNVVRNKGSYSAWLVTRVGVFSTMLSMGTENFCIALHDNPSLVETILDTYFDWTVAMAERVCQLGFDVFVSTDDMAFKSAPFFSPRVFHDLLLPRYRKVASKVTIPWIAHSDGNLMPFLDDLLSVGLAGLHPNEKGAMDIRAMKRDYGRKVCLLGNVDLNILTLGTEEDVDQEVRELIRDVGPGGGYIVTSGNSLASYVKPENAVAMSQAVKKYGQYPLDV